MSGIPIMNGNEFVDGLLKGDIGVKRDGAIKEYHAMRKIWEEEMQKLDIEYIHKNTKITIGKGRIVAETQLKGGLRKTEVEITRYWSNRGVLKLNERRVLVKMLESVPLTSIPLRWKELSEEGVVFTIESIYSFLLTWKTIIG